MSLSSILAFICWTPSAAPTGSSTDETRGSKALKKEACDLNTTRCCPGRQLKRCFSSPARSLAGPSAGAVFRAQSVRFLQRPGFSAASPGSAWPRLPLPATNPWAKQQQSQGLPLSSAGREPSPAREKGKQGWSQRRAGSCPPAPSQPFPNRQRGGRERGGGGSSAPRFMVEGSGSSSGAGAGE